MFMYQLTEESELFLIEPIHADELFALVDSNREYLCKWVSWPDRYNSSEDMRTYIRDCLHRYAEDGNPYCGIRYQGELAGTIDMINIDNSIGSASIGYWLGEQFQGKGLVSAAARPLINHGFSSLNLNRIELTALPGNDRCRAVALRLGFRYEGTLRQVIYSKDGFQDRDLYGLLRDNWQHVSEPLVFSYSLDHNSELRLLQPYDAEILHSLSDANREHLGTW